MEVKEARVLSEFPRSENLAFTGWVGCVE